MATRLEIAKNKLERLEKEFEEATQALYAHTAQTNGQPMNDKRNGQSFFNKSSKLEEKVFNKLHEIEEQKERISRLEDQVFRKENHLTASFGLQTCVQNLDEFKNRKQDKKTRDKIDKLEKILEKSETDKRIMSDTAKSLVESGKVNRWEKQPIYYFVKGLRKVALVVDDNGEFMVSKKYPTKDEKEREFIKDLLK